MLGLNHADAIFTYYPQGLRNKTAKDRITRQETCRKWVRVNILDMNDSFHNHLAFTL